MCVSLSSCSSPNTFGLVEMDEVGQVAGTAKMAGANNASLMATNHPRNVMGPCTNQRASENFVLEEQRPFLH